MKINPVEVIVRDVDVPGLCRAMSEASPIAMAVVAGVGNIIHYVNPAFCALSNRPKESLLGSAFSDVTSAGNDCLALLERVYRTSESETHIGDEGIPSDSLYWSYAMWPAVAEDGGVAGIVIQVTESTSAHQATVAVNQALILAALRQHELTEKAEALNLRLHAEILDRKRAEEELRRANRDLEQLTYAASHDLQEPLRTITAFTELLARRLNPYLDSETHQYVDYVTKGSRRMSALIKGLLAYGEIGAEDRDQMIAAECGKALEDALISLKAGITDARATVTFESLPVVTANFHQLTQLFQNLIGNALKYRKPDSAPVIHIAASHSGGEWTISVRDNGIGFNLRYAQKIFAVFKRLHGMEYPGTGIGLAICQRIVELHRGRIWAVGEEGVGATFFFTLPDAGPSQGDGLPELWA